MELKELLKKREAASELREKKLIIEFTLESYKDTKFKIKAPNFETFIKLCEKIGIKDFSISKKEMERIFVEKVAKSNAVICDYLFDTFIEPNFTELSGELMVELNVQSRVAIIKSFFSDNEIMEILTLVINRQVAIYNDRKNPAVVELKKK